MTTNITPKQALEFIQKELKNKTMTFENQCVLLDIVDQALAPQEPQQKTFTVEEIKTFFKNNMSELGFMRIPCKKKKVECYNPSRNCRECLLAEFEKEVE